MTRRGLQLALLTGLAVLLGLLGLVAPTAAGAATNSPSDEQSLLDLTNQSRAQNGLPALQADPLAAAVARRWSTGMADTATLHHNPDLVAQVDAQVTDDWTRLGENVGRAPSTTAVETAFMNSSAHRANILGDYNRVGIGAVRDSGGQMWVTVIFIKGPALAAASTAPRCSVPTDRAVATASVSRLYRAYFARTPDAAGSDYWVGRYMGGTCLTDVADYFAQSNEFVSTYGALANPDFVRRVYVNVLGRQPDQSGFDYWSGQLNGGMHRGTMMVGFSESPEFRQRSGIA